MKKFLVLLCLASPASAHTIVVNGEIVDYSDYKYNLNGTLNSCCNNAHCRQLADGDAVPVPGGYYVWSLKWFVPNALAQPGPNQHYHACVVNGTPRCFLLPGPGV